MRGKKDYYNVAGIEAEVVMDETLMYAFEANVFKYLYRCNTVLSKGNIYDDLIKAEYYLIMMLLHPKNIRVNIGDRFIYLLNKEVFTTNIYEAICELLTAVAVAGSNYEICTNNALEYVRNELNKY